LLGSINSLVCRRAPAVYFSLQDFSQSEGIGGIKPVAIIALPILAAADNFRRDRATIVGEWAPVPNISAEILTCFASRFVAANIHSHLHYLLAACSSAALLVGAVNDRRNRFNLQVEAFRAVGGMLDRKASEFAPNKRDPLPQVVDADLEVTDLALLVDAMRQAKPGDGE
jgi:hypothetical protein